MSKKAVLPYEIRQECLWIVRGYNRRVKAYYDAVRDVIGGNGTVADSMLHSSDVGRPSESKAARLQAIEDWPETKKMRAVEMAKLHIGADLQNEELRQRLADGIILNCENRNEYPFRYMNLTGISPTDFYRRKDRFLEEIAKSLKMI